MSDRQIYAFRKALLQAAYRLTFLSVLVAPVSAHAQLERFVPPIKTADTNGVDLVSGKLRTKIAVADFDDAATGLYLALEFAGPELEGGGEIYRAVRGVMRSSFRIGGESGYIAEVGEIWNFFLGDSVGMAHPWLVYTYPGGAKASQSLGATHVVQMQFPDSSKDGIYDAAGNWFHTEDKITRANGEEWRAYKQVHTLPYGCTGCGSGPIERPMFIVSSKGYGIQILYETNTVPSTVAGSDQWASPRKVTAYDKAEVFCDESALVECTSLSSLPANELIYSNSLGTLLVRRAGETDGTEYKFASGGSYWRYEIQSIRHTAIANSTVAYEYTTYIDPLAGARYVKKVTSPDGIWNYDYMIFPFEDGHMTRSRMERTDPQSRTVTVAGLPLFGSIDEMYDELGRPTSSGCCSYNLRPGDISFPEGNGIGTLRDVRNNITRVAAEPKTGSSGSLAVLAQASYGISCDYPAACNKPTTVTDANGNVTDYTYDLTHGGVLTETGPAVGGVRPQKRSEYAQRYAWLKNSSGGYSQAATSVWLLTRERYCRTTAASGSSCVGGTADEVVTDFDYGPNSGPNTLLPRGVTITADGVTRRTCFTYDAYGRKISETQPAAGLTSCQ